MKPLFRSLLYGLLPLCCACAAMAQERVFSPARIDSGVLVGLYAGYQQQFKTDLDHLPSSNKKDYEKLYTDRWKNIEGKFEHKEICTAPIASDYLNALVEEIVKANPGIKDHPFHCYFSRSYVPNASYIGEGIILFDMGLFYRLHNESEAAFILCHEIAHYILRHQENSIANYVATINSPELQSQLRKIKGSQYNRNAQLESLVKGLSFDSRRHSRDHEAQADSMGVELMRHTGFDLHGALTTLALLDGIDRNDFDMEAALRRTFNAPAYPFQQKWLHQEMGLFAGHVETPDAQTLDSLKTHPSCPLRIKLLTPIVQAEAGRSGRNYIVDSARFAALQDSFRYEVIEYAYVSGEYTESLFLSLQLLHDRPGDEYIIGHIGRLLNGLYEAQKAHRLGKVAELPSPDQPANYHLLLQFVQNLHLEELAGIDYHFLGRWHPALDHSEVFKEAYEESARLVGQ